jgi:hypothetical protein
MKPLNGLLMFVIVTAVVAALIYMAISNWLECRAHFSFLYCFTQLR